MKYYKLGFCNVVQKLTKEKNYVTEFKKSINHLEYLKKWFQKLRGTLFLEASADKKDMQLAPLSKRYHLTTEEAKAIPEKLRTYIQILNDDISKCTNNEKKYVMLKFKKQVEKYEENLAVPIITTYNNDGYKIKAIPPRTNNCMESFFRSVKTLMRRCTGRNRLSKEFASIGALLPWYVAMKNNQMFSSIFNNERKLCEEFSKLFIHKHETKINLLEFPVKSKTDNFRLSKQLQI